MDNTIQNKKNPIISTSPAWHVGVQAFIALLIILIVPLAINVKSAISVIVSNTHITTSVVKNTPKKTVAITQVPKNQNTLTRFLAAAVFGVNPDTNVIENPETGKETIILPYGGVLNSGGNIGSSGNSPSDRWAGGAPASDGSVPVIYKYQYALPNATTAPIGTGGDVGGGNTNAGGTIQAGGNIQAGGTI